MFQDFRFAFRLIGTHRWFSAAVIVTLALGIGINTTVFTLVNAALFKPVPLPGGERLVAVSHFNPTDPRGRSAISLPDFLVYRAQNRSFAGLEATDRGQAVISENGNPAERFNMGIVSTGLFEMLRTPPILGRGFSVADGRAGAPVVILLGHDAWQRRYAGAADVIGRTVRFNGDPATIIGVMPAGFKFPDNEELWIPLTPTKEREDRTRHNLMVFGLLQPGVSPTQAQGDLVVISNRLAKDHPDTNKDVAAQVQTFHEAFNGGPIKLIFLLMLGAVGFVLLIACANVANMMLSRSIARGREIAVRAAMGASRWQIVRQLLVESVLLSVLGGLLGLGLAAFGVHAFDLATQDVGKPFWVQFTMDWRAFAYFAALSVLSGIVFGLVPALRASRTDLNATLKDGTAGGTRRSGRLTGALVVLQFALTVVLLAGAGLMVRSFLAVQEINPFVPAAHILTARVSLPDGKGDRYESVEARRLMHEKLAARLATLPGVTQVALTSYFPGLGADNRDLEVEGRPIADPKHPPRGAAIFASPNYLAATGLPLLTGRTLAENDGETGREAAVVTRAFAARHWPDQSPVGRRFRFLSDGKPGAWNTVVGVCGDIEQNAMDREAPPVVYLSDRQEPWAWLGLMLRTEGDPAALAPAVRAAVQELDADLPLFEVRTLPAALEHEHWFIKVFGSLFFTFAVIALLMASVGLYAVVAQTTARRTREIGIRMALGATTGCVVRLVLSRGLAQLAAGLVLGLGGAFAATRLMSTLLAVSPTDPVVFATVPVLLAVIGLFACWLPARRAARIAPTEALRTE
ncbi:ABC transporter permease [Opitutus sp. GAS368]|uniref:ABC transporter permease n=1 Tax=Opitutus sp. GAS368 TaxID=1882749 RepID=UPI00087CFBC5|nr:ABC transporter permease [Opitutus sp. GAS368]SDS16956.1 duplicated orphan permease [Opitutus sp. GAS368]